MNTKFYICKHCGNIITFAKASGAPVSCCGDGVKVTVTVGEVNHPMTEEHFIEWIALETDDELILKKLTPADPPKAEFTVAENKKITAFSYCNLHSLWKN